MALPFDLPEISRGFAELTPGARRAGEKLAQLAAAALGSALGWDVTVAGRALPGVPVPGAGCANLAFELPAVPAAAILEVDPGLVARMVDALAGSSGETPAATSLSPIETAALELFALLAIEGIRSDSEISGRLAPRLIRSPAFVQSPLSLDLEIRAKGSTGRGRLIVSGAAVRALRGLSEIEEPLSAAAVTASHRQGETSLREEELEALSAGDVLLIEPTPDRLVFPAGRRLTGRAEEGTFHVEEIAMTETAATFPVTLEVELARVPIPLAELSRLEPGAALPLPIDRRGLVTLRIGERAVAQGELVDIEGAIGVRILKLEA